MKFPMSGTSTRGNTTQLTGSKTWRTIYSGTHNPGIYKPTGRSTPVPLRILQPAFGIIFAMILTTEEVLHIAALAKLHLSAGEVEQYREQLSQILEFASQLQSVDTVGIPPTSSVLPARSVLREDVPSGGLDEGELFSNAPDYQGSQFRVPPVLE
jgi:aspartyl-tRNA(Asn)/glutamyl-tRNA(Gln) amidotransferase subunit C